MKIYTTLKKFFSHTHVQFFLYGLCTFILIFYATAIKPPFDFPRDHFIEIPQGVSIREAGIILEREHVIHSADMFSLLAQLLDDGSGVKSGVYEFTAPLSIFGVIERVFSGDTGRPLVRVTIFEGVTVRHMAEIFESRLSQFDGERFKELALPYEGYLFPETYFFSPGATPEIVIGVMRRTFEERIQDIQEEIDAFGRPLHDVITMASILDREARLYETKRIVAGILWKREAERMPLQVDAVFGYIFERDTFNPTFADLEVESPYNTYRNLGLPPGPIANPGIDSIRAAVNPVETPYYFYLTGVDGRMYYGRTFDEHVANRRFLR